jgi:hypothetical protein
MGWLVSSGVSQLPFCPSCSQAIIILPNGKVAENPEMFEIGHSDRQLYRWSIDYLENGTAPLV